MPHSPLSKAFLRRAGAAGERLAALPAIDGLLSTILSAAHAAWPNVDIDDALFVSHVARHIGAATDPVKALVSLHSGDLYLACACAAGDPRALSSFERAFITEVPAFVARIDPSREFADEVAQILRQRLLLAHDGAPPRIGDYAGGGALGGWLRVAAVRTARNLQRDRQAGIPLVADGEKRLSLRPTAADPELDYVRARHGSEFRAAFQTTLAALSPKERNVLCLYFIDGMSGAAIGALYRVHGATVRRWIEGLRKTILDETCRLLAERLKLSSAEVDSIARLVQSQLDLNISTFLRRPTLPTPE